MEIKKGIPVSPGVAICPAAVLDAEDIHVPRRVLPRRQLPREHQRFERALEAASGELEKLRDDVSQELGAETAAIFGFHMGILHDKHLIQQVHDMMDAEAVTAEFALATVLRKYAQVFLQMDNPLFRERVTDVWDVERRVLKHLMANVRADLTKLDQEAIIVAHDLTPSQTASLDKRHIRALATEAGGRTSHTAIVARAMGIPCVVGLEGLSTAVSTGDILIVDGNRGLVIINPDPQQLEEYRGYVERLQIVERRLGELLKLPARTTDGVTVELMANIEFPTEIPIALSKGAAGVGLYRSEYLFLSTETEPTEEQQYEAFVKAVKYLEGRPLTIRTLDLGADKYTQSQATMQERNPFLGCRSIRYCLQNLAMFKPHLRAILRASAHGPLRIMFPLVSNMMELRQARMILNDVMEDLEEQSIPFDRELSVGIMVEVPSAALMAKVFINEVDFFSIGTNDLVQYTLAVDRGNEHVANLYSGAHPAVLMLVKDVIRAAKRGNIEVSCCGEIAGELDYIMLLVGMGLRNLSMTPQAIPGVKQLIRSVSIKDCERVARRVASYDSERQVLNYLREETRKVIPDAYDGRAMS
jgi:phosphoenolpyruvate-protein phosphotransferase (PTS system enzyme I)